ncbi:MAG TPA: polymer-forming cytoskeletal protein [Anaerolineae bacterium]|nr:polymer-forming cytoskeletal protein [Anaerolineae bacterium]HQH38164.1 polymer-forming cytoskeletal protein [Anaerolineae bacterium]
MTKRLIFTVILAMFLAAVAWPVQAAPGGQGDGGVHFGPYTLAAGSSVSGDLTVFGGPVTLKDGSSFNGDLTVFGATNVQEGAHLDGTLVVFGAATIAGNIDGDVFVTGAVTLEETAYVSGDVSATGAIDQRDGAVVEGDVSPLTKEDFNQNFPIKVPKPFVNPQVQVHTRPGWFQVLWGIVKGVASVVALSLLALVIVSVWPQQTERAGRAVEEAALTSFGTGLLLLIAAIIVLTLLTITICLSPIAFLGWLVIGVGVLLGWVALGLILGKRVLSGVFNQPQPQAVSSAVLGTALMSLVLALARVSWPIYSILLFVLMPLAAGAVVLTRFGTRPYATRGQSSATPRAPQPPHAGGSIMPGAMPSPQAPAAGPVPSASEEDFSGRSQSAEEF